ncbi:hypothetical protein MJ904_14515 [Massilia sp. MB5]|uniref:hypothetical protein n=1 Tax=unclassified Massilia TaxID=2609279 RepID=UPI00067A782A|nr:MULTISPECIES: hypothetical protein [unclassified Massilia]AKU22009.1 hypothetical protein ACZ75_11570 [Massilia sp. NR 4-1]UMR28385.1 hypothetical protein MJ904_14515 [Massilia sp. MB5]
MKPRHLLMGGALLTAAGLALFGDKTPSGEVAEAVDRPTPRAGKEAGNAVGKTPAPAVPPDAAVPVAASPSAASAPAAPPAEAPPAAGGKTAGAANSAILRLIPRALLIGEAGEASFKSGEGVFLGQNWNPPPPPPVAPPPPPPPSAPPLPYSYIGKSVADGEWEVYLSRGDRTYIAHQKQVIDGTYRIDRIAPPELTITYLPLNQVQQLNIGAID